MSERSCACLQYVRNAQQLKPLLWGLGLPECKKDEELRESVVTTDRSEIHPSWRAVLPGESIALSWAELAESLLGRNLQALEARREMSIIF